MWVAALSSDTYPQCFGRLRTKSAFCALGVLCVLYEQHHLCALPGDDELPPTEVLRWSGLSLTGTERVRAANDDEYLSFAEIARIIRKEAADL